MEYDNKCGSSHQKDKSLDKASREFPGMAVNQGDSDKTDASLVKERTRTLNNNPRNNK